MTYEAVLQAHGRVQGVNFRNTVARYALEHNIKGYVQNLKDGTVLIVAQGSKDLLEAFVVWIKSNPGFAKVERVDERWRTVSGVFEDFRVERSSGIFRDKGASLVQLFKFLTRKQRTDVPLVAEESLAIPQHVALIPDGNRRWAKERGLESSSGHYSASQFDHGMSLLRTARDAGVACFSIWAFSTENWKRDSKEVHAIFDLVENWLDRVSAELHENKIRFVHLGRNDRIPPHLAARIAKLVRETSQYTDFTFALCLDYGGRDEIIRTIGRMHAGHAQKLTESEFSSHLDSAGLPDPDLIIRTGGEQRLSGFFLYQAAYAELYFTETFFPDFGPDDLRRALNEFGHRKRRFGS